MVKAVGIFTGNAFSDLVTSNLIDTMKSAVMAPGVVTEAVRSDGLNYWSSA
jgi:hypothetical protein